MIFGITLKILSITFHCTYFQVMKSVNKWFGTRYTGKTE